MSDDRIVISVDELGVAPETSSPQSLPPIGPPPPRAVLDVDQPGSPPPPPNPAAKVKDRAAAPPTSPHPQSGAVPADLAPVSGRPANYGSRVGAAVLDAVLQTVVIVVVYVVFFLALLVFPPLVGLVLVLGGILATSLLVVIAPMARNGARNGQTYGMQLSEIRKVRESGEPFTTGFALFWWWVPGLLFSITIIGGFVNAVWPLFHPQQRSLRDLITKTETLRVPESPPASSRPG